MRRSPCFRNFLLQTVWLFCLSLASLPLSAAVTPQNDRAKMYHAEEWEGTITLTNHDNFSQKDDATNIIYKLSTNRSLTFHVRLNERKRFVFDAKHESAAWNSDASQSSGHGDAKDVYTEIVDGESSHETLSAKYDGPVPSKWIWFAIQPQTNQYSLTVNTLYADAVIDNGYEKTVDKDGFATPLAEIEDEPLPTTGTTLNGTKVITYEYTEPTNHGLTNKIRYTVTWSLHPAGPPPELVIDKESFKNYVPGDDTGYVRIFSKKPDSSPAAVRVFLSGVSTQPGTCMNSKTSDTNPDLEFDTSANTAFNAPTKKGDEWMMETKEEVREVKVAIRSHDYGAYGKLRAEAKIKGEWTPIKIAGTEQTSLNYPLDENNNKIADAWERQEGIYGAGHAANWDEENTPVLNGKQPGDGLTLYEEYRGIMAQGKHRRLSGARKDLVVENHVTQAASGIALFAKATGLNVITVNSGELLPKPG
ncbi:MAG TPA: hypothetical protein VHV83_17905, partial [Armatimonadota bacterium]|nr:hypothetical protein [Armatimonadota bacterium]